MLKRSFLFSFLVMAGVVSAQTVIPGGVIDEDTIWTVEGSPYRIGGDLLILSEATLSIDPGVEVILVADPSVIRIIVSGFLHAEGLPSTPVVFRSEDDNDMVLFSHKAPDGSFFHGRCAERLGDAAHRCSLLRRYSIAFHGRPRGARGFRDTKQGEETGSLPDVTGYCAS